MLMLIAHLSFLVFRRSTRRRSIDTANLQVYGGFYNGGHRTATGPSAALAAASLLIAVTLRALQTGVDE